MNEWPQLRLDFYPQAVLMSRWQNDGRVTTYPVSITDVMTACSEVTISSGLLPANTLFYGQQGGQTTIGIYVPARRWHVQVAMPKQKTPQPLHLPLPPLLFVGQGRRYAIYAVKKRPLAPDTLLFHAPCPNVHAHGTVCQGNTPFPTSAPNTILLALNRFLCESGFNGDLVTHKCRRYPNDVRQLWAELNGQRRFPLGQLLPMNRCVGDLL